ncbi:MAG: CapA family protein [Elusimicrobiota bacterium]
MAALSGLAVAALLLAANAGAQPAPEAAGTVTLVAVGDIRLDGPFGDAARRRGMKAPTDGVRAALAGDIVHGNLECALTRRGQAADKKYTFKAPAGNAAILRAAGFTHVTLANNHVMDFGAAGMRDTLEALRAAGIQPVGAGADAAAAAAPVFIERNGLRIGMLAVTSTLPEDIRAGAAKPGVAYSDVRLLKEQVREAKRRCDILIASYHGGTELSQTPNPVQEEIFGLLLDGGADVVIGHHPHVLQPIRSEHGRLALFSLGNFLFVSPTPGTQWTVIARLRLSRTQLAAEFVPLEIGPGRFLPAGPYGRELIKDALDPTGTLLLWDEESAVFRLRAPLDLGGRK